MDATTGLYIEQYPNDTYLVGNCKRNGGGWNQSKLRLDSCLGDNGGRFEWGGTGFTEQASNIRFNAEEGAGHNPILRADLRDSAGRFLPNKDVNLAERINNYDGNLEFHCQISSDTCLERRQAQELLMKIALDKNLQDKLWVALDEGSEIFMVAEKNLYYEIELKDEPLPRGVQWEYKDLEVILIDGLDEKYREQGGWVNRPPVRGERPLILIPKLGGNFNDAIFLNYDPSVQDARD